MVAPVGGQILSEVLPYMEIEKDNSEEKAEETEIEVPEIRGKTIEEAEKTLKELQIELEINDVDIKEINKKETIIKEQLPKPGIKILNNKKVYVDIER